MNSRQLTFTSIMVVLIAVGAFIRIPIPLVPITLQVFFTSIAGILLGPRLGTLATATYVILGLIGLPIFTAGGGLTYVFNPTFGYLLGFILGTWVTGYLAHRHQTELKPWQYTLAVLAGYIPVYLCGVLYCYVISVYVLHVQASMAAILYTGFLVPIPGDIVLAVIIGLISPRLVRESRRYNIIPKTKIA